MENITSRKNPVIQHFKKLGTDRSYRNEKKQFVCDSIKLFEEAVMWNADIDTVLVAEGTDINIPVNIRAYTVSAEMLKYVSTISNPAGVIFTCNMPGSENCVDIFASNILLENVQDPGNVGTVMRTAGAFGIDTVILCGACADIYNPKTIRSTMGAVFRQKYAYLSYEEISELTAKGLKLYGAALHQNSADVRAINLKGSTVCIGSEGKGLSESMLNLCTGTVVLPMNPKCESLNAAVAAALMMWEMFR